MNIKLFTKRFLNLLRRPVVKTASIAYLSPNNRLKGKKIIITGGGRGLGRAMAEKFVAEGAQVLITGRNEDSLKNVSATINCQYLVYDVSDISGMDSFLKEADNLLGGVNVLVNNAGISLHEGNIFNVNENGYDAQFSINLKGGYFLTQKFLKLYESNSRTNGSVLFLSSERGQYVDDIPYGLIKSAINSLTQGLAKAHIRKNIRINAIAPGITATEMTKRSVDNLEAPNYSTGRWYLPNEVAEVASFLISDAAGCLSGQILVCNNGYSINSYKK